MSLRSISGENEYTLAYFARAPREKVKALLIDDDVTDVAIFNRLAAKSKHLDFQLQVCGSTEEAERLASDQTFDVVFVDYWMGLQTSIAFISEFSKLQQAPCVLLTGLDEPDIRRLAFRAGVKAFLSKEDISTQAIDGVTLTVLRARAEN